MNLKNVTPVLTGSISDSANAYASSYSTDGSSYAWKAFDNKSNTKWTSGVRAKTAWLELLFNKETIVDHIKVVNTDNIRLPKQILVYGSNDRKTYELIHTVSDITVDMYPLSFKIPRSNYKCYRLTFPESHFVSDSAYEYFFKIAEVYFYEDLDYRGMSEKIKDIVFQTIVNHKMMQNHVLIAEIKNNEGE